jgi:hypothetical protein
VTSAFGLTSRLVEERIEQLLCVAGTLDDLVDEPARFVRLAAGALALVQQHAVDNKGRCRFCTRRRRWRRVRARPCTVHAAFSAYLTQPDDLVQRQITELTRRRHSVEVTVMTRPTPRLGDW